MRDFLIAGNWKMNGSTAFNAELVSGIVAGAPGADGVKLLVCPPFPYLSAVVAAAAGSNVAVGAAESFFGHKRLLSRIPGVRRVHASNLSMKNAAVQSSEGTPRPAGAGPFARIDGAWTHRF